MGRRLEPSTHILGIPRARLRDVRCLALAAVALLSPQLVAAEPELRFPVKPIRIMAPANPGGGWDQLARLVQHTLTSQGIVPVPVEVFNRGGAGGTIGLAELVARHHGDAHTLMIGGSVLVGSELTHGSPFSLRDATPLAILLSEYLVIAVPGSSPFRSLQDLLRAFAEDPETITWGGGSAGGIDHILVGLLADHAGVEITRTRYVAFPGGGDAAAAVMGGKVSAGVSGYAEWEGLATGGRMRLLAVSAPARVGDQQLPTLLEQGVEVTLANWRGVFAAPGIRPAERDWYIRALTEVRHSSQWQELLLRNHWTDTFLVGGELGEFLQQDYATTGRVLEKLGLGKGGEGYAIVGPYAFPLAIGAGMLLSLLLMLLQHLRPATNRRAEAGPDGALAHAVAGGHEPDVVVLPPWSKFLQVGGITLAYVLLLKPLSFIVATPLFIVSNARAMGSRSLLRDCLVAVALTAAIFLAFRYVLGVELP